MKKWTEKELEELIKPYKSVFGVEVWEDPYEENIFEVYMWQYDDECEERGKYENENQSIYPNGSEQHQLGSMTKEEILEDLELWKNGALERIWNDFVSVQDNLKEIDKKMKDLGWDEGVKELFLTIYEDMSEPIEEIESFTFDWDAINKSDSALRISFTFDTKNNKFIEVSLTYWEGEKEGHIIYKEEGANMLSEEQKRIIIELMEGYTHYELDNTKDNTGGELHFIQEEEITFKSIEDFKKFQIEVDIYAVLECL